jgi:hypothetical protein
MLAAPALLVRAMMVRPEPGERTTTQLAQCLVKLLRMLVTIGGVTHKASINDSGEPRADVGGNVCDSV